MPKIIPEGRLKEAITNGTFLKNAKIENAEGIKYDFSMSPKILKAKYGQPIDANQLPEKERAELFVEPGEVVFVLTEEILDLPNNMKAILSPKRKMSHDGIMTLGGSCIDPLYKGRLLIGLYNFASSPFPLKPGKKLIAALFYQLEDNELDEFKELEAEIKDFPDDLVRLITKYSPISVQSIMDVVNDLQMKFDEIRKEFRDREDWFKKFEKSLEGHDRSIDKILATIERGVEERRHAERDLERRITEVSDRAAENIQKYSKDAYKTAAVVGTLGALIISLIVYLLQTLITRG